MRAHWKRAPFPPVPWQSWHKELAAGSAMGAGQEELLCTWMLYPPPTPPTVLIALQSNRDIIKPPWDYTFPLQGGVLTGLHKNLSQFLKKYLEKKLDLKQYTAENGIT